MVSRRRHSKAAASVVSMDVVCIIIYVDCSSERDRINGSATTCNRPAQREPHIPHHRSGHTHNLSRCQHDSPGSPFALCATTQAAGFRIVFDPERPSLPTCSEAAAKGRQPPPGRFAPPSAPAAFRSSTRRRRLTASQCRTRGSAPPPAGCAPGRARPPQCPRVSPVPAYSFCRFCCFSRMAHEPLPTDLSPPYTRPDYYLLL